ISFQRHSRRRQVFWSIDWALVHCWLLVLSSAAALLLLPVLSIHSGFWLRCLRSPAWATPSITPPTTRSSHTTSLPTGSDRHSRCILSPACLVRRWRREACWLCRVFGGGAEHLSAPARSALL